MTRNTFLPARRRLWKHLWLLASPALLPTVLHAHGDAHAPPTARETVREQTDWGIGAAPAEARRTIEIRMDDRMRFTPDHIEVTEGETLRLRIANRGRKLHELVIGTPKELQAHAELMRKFPNMEHDEPYMAHVGAGRRGEITWTFNRPGDFEFACLIPGHYEAGMRGTLRVIPKP
ncbi:MAG: cupredoxin family protein [Hyphomonas sp.]|nr:cupredoxin family protein [Hyphomonas sp.]